jgi:hypothetical protein
VLSGLLLTEWGKIAAVVVAVAVVLAFAAFADSVSDKDRQERLEAAKGLLGIESEPDSDDDPQE